MMNIMSTVLKGEQVLLIYLEVIISFESVHDTIWQVAAVAA